MFPLSVLLAALVVFEASSEANTLELDETENVVVTTTHKFGEDVRLDCNFSNDLALPVWRRERLNRSQLLYVGLTPIRGIRNVNLSSVNYSLLVNPATIDDEGLYLCLQSGRILTSFRLKVTVASEIVIQHDGKNLSGIYFASKGEKLQLDCIVFRTRENPGIEWKVGITTLVEGTNETTRSSNKFVQGTFDYRKGLIYVVQRDTNLVCSTYTDYSTSVSVKLSTVSSQTSDPGNNTANSTDDTTDSTNYTANATNYSSYTALITVVTISSVITVLAGAWVCTKRYKGKESHGNIPRELAGIPRPKPSYASNIVQKDYYSPASYNLPTSKVFLRKRIHLVNKLSDGVICERWVGKVTPAKRENSALISQHKGVIHFEHFSWDTLVKRLLELPDNEYIFKVKGMCFNKPHLFLLQDYMTSQWLNEYLSTMFVTDVTQNDMDMFVSEFTNISLQVCYGMEFAMMYGLSHPALSTRKILINEDGICKLYDFCLTEDASEFVECLKTEPDFSGTRHPPECVARNEYTCASDVWYTAFSVREIYSYGCKQFPCEGNFINEESEIYALPLQSCPTSVYEQIRKCMTPNDNERPKTVQELLTILKELDLTFVSNSPAHVEEKIRKYSYVPMIDGTGEVLYSLPVKNKEVIT